MSTLIEINWIVHVISIFTSDQYWIFIFYCSILIDKLLRLCFSKSVSTLEIVSIMRASHCENKAIFLQKFFCAIFWFISQIAKILANECDHFQHFLTKFLPHFGVISADGVIGISIHTFRIYSAIFLLLYYITRVKYLNNLMYILIEFFFNVFKNAIIYFDRDYCLRVSTSNDRLMIVPKKDCGSTIVPRKGPKTRLV